MEMSTNMTPEIFYLQAYDPGLKYGSALNRHIELLPDDSWICVTDGDTLFLTPMYGRIILEAIRKHGHETDVFTCQMNRLGDPKRCFGGVRSEDDRIKYHMRVSNSLKNEYAGQVEEVEDRIIPGAFMLFPKRVWLKNKFDDKDIIAAGGSFDIRWSERITGSMKKILDLYIWHSYRIDRANPLECPHLFNQSGLTSSK